MIKEYVGTTKGSNYMALSVYSDFDIEDFYLQKLKDSLAPFRINKVAEATGLIKATIYSYLDLDGSKKWRVPNMTAMVRLASYTKTPLSDFSIFEKEQPILLDKQRTALGNNQTLNPDENTIITKYRTLSEDKKDFLMKFIATL